MNDIMYKTKELFEKKIGEVINKGDINPNEMDCVYKAVKSIGQIATIEAMERARWTEEESRRMQTVSHGYPYEHYPVYDHDVSMARSRNALGQFTSHDSGYSGHSVNDRMIDQLEHMITPTTPDYERQEIMEQIRQIREKK
jgi:hypothetical protein